MNYKKGLWGIASSTLTSGGVLSHGSVSGYLSDAARRALGIGLSHFEDGAVHYFAKDTKILKRAIRQTASQLAYGMLRSYPRYLKYWEQKNRDKYLQTLSQTSLANKSGQYYQLIKEQQAVAALKSYSDTIVGNVVSDYLELTISEEGSYYDSKAGKIESNKTYGITTFVDLQPMVQVSSKNNVVLTTVQGRDYTRKEFISGGDLEITINGKITSKYPDVYPEAEVSKFLRLMQYKGVIDCDNIILRQLNINRLILLSYNLTPSEFRNIQNYSISCVAVEPSESIQLKLGEQEKVDDSIADTNKWLKAIRFGTDVIEPTALLKITQKWI